MAGGESDADFLLRGNSLLRVYREDMAALSSGAQRGCGRPESSLQLWAAAERA